MWSTTRLNKQQGGSRNPLDLKADKEMSNEYFLDER
jgi:hypothetical protein